MTERAASGRYLIFLNNDTIPLPGWLDKLVIYADNNPAAAVVGTKMLFPDNTIQHAGVVVCQDRDVRHIYAGFPADHPATNKSRRFQVVTAGWRFFGVGPSKKPTGSTPLFARAMRMWTCVCASAKEAIRSIIATRACFTTSNR